MLRNFDAEIKLNIVDECKENIVKIIPFSDRDKHIAKILEKVLNHHLINESLIDIDGDDHFRRMTREIR